MWKSILSITIGATLGSLLRWFLGLKMNNLFPTLPPGTLAANLIGCYIIGFAIAILPLSPTLLLNGAYSLSLVFAVA